MINRNSMQKQQPLSQLALKVGLVVGGILMIPLVAMRLTADVDWSLVDFAIMGTLLFGTGFSFVLATRYVTEVYYRLAVGLALGSTLFMIWANLAVGLIGSGPNAGNLLSMLVPLIGLVGSAWVRVETKLMERVMYTMATAMVIIAIIALLLGMQHGRGSSVTEVIGVSGFFAAAFVTSGLLFRQAAMVASKAEK